MICTLHITVNVLSQTFKMPNINDYFVRVQNKVFHLNRAQLSYFTSLEDKISNRKTTKDLPFTVSHVSHARFCIYIQYINLCMERGKQDIFLTEPKRSVDPLIFLNRKDVEFFRSEFKLDMNFIPNDKQRERICRELIFILNECDVVGFDLLSTKLAAYFAAVIEQISDPHLICDILQSI